MCILAVVNYLLFRGSVLAQLHIIDNLHFCGVYFSSCELLVVQVNKSVVKAAVKSSVEVGYRHFDTASLYYTEESLGETLNDLISSKLISRDDVFVTTKV